MLNRVDFISSGVGILESSVLSSLVMHGRTRCSRWGGKLSSPWLNKFLYLSKKRLLIELVFMSHVPLSSWIASMLFCLRLIIVDRWKNLVFLSLSLSHNSLDFWCHKDLLLRSHSDNSDWSACSLGPVFSEGGSAWTALIFCSKAFILSCQFPKTSLFHFWRASLVEACFLQNLMNSEPMTFSFQASSMTEEHRSSLS